MSDSRLESPQVPLPATTVVGVAVVIPEPWRTQLADARRDYGDKLAELVTPHITILPPSPVPAIDLPAIEEHLAAVAEVMPAFTVDLRGSGTFAPISPVAYVTLTHGVSRCEQLEALVRAGVLERELRFPYHPHVTVAQEVEDDVLARAVAEHRDFEASFRATEMWLYEQLADGSWLSRASFAFAG